jgi:hypothetical protein
MKLLSTAMAVFIAIFGLFFFPFPGKFLARGVLYVVGLEPHPSYLFMAQVGVSLLIGFGITFVVFRAMGVGIHVGALVAHRSWLQRGLIGVAAFLVLVPILFVLSAIPYGGGAAPGWTWLILLVSWLSLGYGLIRTLFQELKAVRSAKA